MRGVMFVLDTHAWIEWLLKPETLPDSLRKSLDSSAGQLAISAITCYECSLLVERGRIALSMPLEQWLPQALAENDMRVLPITPALSIRAAQLPQIHRDPWDRLIIATALEYDAPLVTRDEVIPRYPVIRVVWDSVPPPNGDGEPA